MINSKDHQTKRSLVRFRAQENQTTQDPTPNKIDEDLYIV